MAKANYKQVIKADTGINVADWQELWKKRELLWVLVRRDLRVRYKNTFLGIFWIILPPLLNTLIFVLVFSSGLKLGNLGENYLVSTLIGFIFWQFFSGSLASAAGSVHEQIALVKKIYFPRLYLPLTIIFRSLFDFLLATFFLLIIVVSQQIPLTFLSLAVFFLVLFTLTIFTSGLSFIFASLHALYRDFRHLIPFILQVWLYITPVFYPASFLQGKFSWLLKINPLANFLQLVRQAVFTQNFSWSNYLFWFFLSLGVWIFGFFIFKKMETEIVDWT